MKGRVRMMGGDGEGKDDVDCVQLPSGSNQQIYVGFCMESLLIRILRLWIQLLSTESNSWARI